MDDATLWKFSQAFAIDIGLDGASGSNMSSPHNSSRPHLNSFPMEVLLRCPKR
jgi:hypothetical protein